MPFFHGAIGTHSLIYLLLRDTISVSLEVTTHSPFWNVGKFIELIFYLIYVIKVSGLSWLMVVVLTGPLTRCFNAQSCLLRNFCWKSPSNFYVKHRRKWVERKRERREEKDKRWSRFGWFVNWGRLWTWLVVKRSTISSKAIKVNKANL